MKKARYLSKRQLELLKLAANGYTNVRISETLGISACTATEILSRAYAALGVRDRTQAVVAALHLQLFSLDDLQLPTKIRSSPAEENVRIPEVKVSETPRKTVEFTPSEVNFAFRMADIMLHLDRCQHGRREGDPCGSCGVLSEGNPHIRPGQTLGYDLRGNQISMPPRDEKWNPGAWRG